MRDPRHRCQDHTTTTETLPRHGNYPCRRCGHSIEPGSRVLVRWQSPPGHRRWFREGVECVGGCGETRLFQ
jgi:hypothetical protein